MCVSTIRRAERLGVADADDEVCGRLRSRYMGRQHMDNMTKPPEMPPRLTHLGYTSYPKPSSTDSYHVRVSQVSTFGFLTLHSFGINPKDLPLGTSKSPWSCKHLLLKVENK